MMELLNIDNLKMLLKEHQKPCISIFMPTHRRGKDVEQDPIRFKNLLHGTAKSAMDQGFRSSEVKELIYPAERLLDDTNFWRHQNEGLAVFIAPQEFSCFRLPVQFEELAVVSHRFHIKPLIPLVSVNGHFFILAIGQKYPRLFHGSHYSLSEVEIKEVIPQSLEEALKFDEPEKQTQFHTRTPEVKGGRRAAVFHGQGVDTDEVRHKKDILRYFQMIDRGLHAMIAGEHSPLVIAGVEYLLPIYREANTYPHLIEEGIPANPEDMSEDELHDRAWKAVEPEFQKSQMEASSLYRQLAGSGRTSHDLQEIIEASYHDRIDILFVTSGLQKWGTFDPQSIKVIIHRERQPGDEDLLDLAAVQTLLHRGDVYILQPEQMPDHYPLAAVFRF
ncbi:MAG: hypothetical protein AB1611_00695 [bacterium]